MSLKIFYLFFIFSILNFIIWISVGCERNTPMLEFSGPTMGTYYAIKIARPPAGLTAQELQPEVTEILDQVIAEISTYDQNSELSRLNQNPSTAWIPISSNLAHVMAEGLRLAELTDGAFDPTIGPLVNLWGFGPGAMKNQQHVPDPEEILAAQERVGWRKLELRLNPPAIHKARPDLFIDLSALGEGYGVDQIAARFDARGLTDYLIAVAGTLRAKGLNAQKHPWEIAIEEPLPEQRTVHRILAISDHAVSTSGDYRNFFEQDGQRYSHEINPQTGAPVTHHLGSVTVVGDPGLTVDGLATALMVLGENQGLKFATEQEVAAYFIAHEGKSLRSFNSPAFTKIKFLNSSEK